MDETAEYSSVHMYLLLFLLLQALLPHIMEKMERCHQRKQLYMNSVFATLKKLI